MVVELCRSPTHGLSALERREEGLDWEGCSDSEPLEALDDELEVVGDRLGRLSDEYIFVLLLEVGSG